jgi:hypothetical protein
MKSRSTFHLFLFATFALASSAAFAATDADELEKAGYLGYWAEDCRAPPSRRNWHIVASDQPDGSVTNTTYNKPGTPLSVIGIRFVRRLPNNHVEIQLLGSDTKDSTETIDLTILIEPLRMRTLRVAAASTGVTVQDGKSLKGNTPMPWLYRCS